MLSQIAAMRRSSCCADRTLVPFAVLCLVLSPLGAARAQDAQPPVSTPPVQLPAISVTVPPPSRPTISAAGNSVVVSPTTVPTPSFEFASSTTVITGADIESHQYRTVPDALSLVPGLNIVQTGGPLLPSIASWLRRLSRELHTCSSPAFPLDDTPSPLPLPNKLPTPSPPGWPPNSVTDNWTLFGGSRTC